MHGAEGAAVLPTIDEVSKVLEHSPNEDGPFASPAFSQKLVHQIGLDGDDNKNLTRRLLFLLESIPVTGEKVYGTVRDEILGRYLDEYVKPYRPPRFLFERRRSVLADDMRGFRGKGVEGTRKVGYQKRKAAHFAQDLVCWRPLAGSRMLTL